MDTSEGYFYAGRMGLTASELLFMICCEKIAEQLGIDDFGSIVAVLAGLNILPTRGKPAGAIPNTSIASKAARGVFKQAQFPYRIRLPSIVGTYMPLKLKIRMVSKIGSFVGRAVPVVGWIILAEDVMEIATKTVFTYNRIAKGSDKIW